MTEFDFIAYMKNIAETHTDIQHSSSNAHFFLVSGIGQLDEFLSRINKVNAPALCVEVNPEGQVISPLDNNVIDIPTYRFYILNEAGSGKFEDMQNAKKNSKSLGFKLLAKIKHDKHQALYYNVDNGLHYVELNFNYQVLGPLAQKWYGCMFTIRLEQSAYDAGMIYDPDEYST